MKFVRKFSEIRQKDVATAGGKGASLGEMAQAGFPVPDGFVVLANAFDNFSHDSEIPKDLEEEIVTEFKSLDVELVAVRSSATAEDGAVDAWSGQLESFLNTDQSSLLENVKKCWGSLFTPRAITYRHEKGLDTKKISVAVVVQKMIQSEMSGVAFSAHPVTQNKNEILVEAITGLGEALVSGSVTPDSYVVLKEPRKVENISINLKDQVLNEDQILELTGLILKIENHYGFPCDIEWAYEKGKFYILQSRPITTLGEKFDIPDNIFAGYRMISLGKRRTHSHEASLKVLAGSQIWTREFGVGYEVSVMNSLGEHYVDLESKNKVVEFFGAKDMAYAQKYMQKLSRLRQEVLAEIRENSSQDYGEKFTCMLAYFFAIKVIFGKIYVKSSPDEQKIIDNWRNDETIFEPLDLYYKLHPEKDTESDHEWSWVYIHGELQMYEKNISFATKAHETIESKKAEFETSETILGNTAFPGVVRGKARVILFSSDKQLLKDGEIIVAPMTTVDFMPIMSKALAFVTDEGGVTSHAAIVARELKKPCVIGTKIASQVLKTGMKIEVDADNGIVRVISL